MTTLELILSILLYISLGMWICHKRNWYNKSCDGLDDSLFLNGFAIAFMPINLIIVLIRELILREWDSY